MPVPSISREPVQAVFPHVQFPANVNLATKAQEGATLLGGRHGEMMVDTIASNNPVHAAAYAIALEKFFPETVNEHHVCYKAHVEAVKDYKKRAAETPTETGKEAHAANLTELETAVKETKASLEEAHTTLGNRLATTAVLDHMFRNPDAPAAYATPASVRDLEGSVKKANTNSKLAIGGAVTGIATVAGGSMLFVHSKNKANAKKIAAEKQQASRQVKGAKAQVDRLKQNVQEYQAALQELAQQQRNAGSAAA